MSPAAQRLLDASAEILGMAAELRDRGLVMESVAVALQASQIIKAVKALERMDQAFADYEATAAARRPG